MMTLDEAIQHCLEVAEKKEREAKSYPKADGRKGSGIRRYKCVKCAEEHRQLEEWLKELKYLHCVNDKLLEFLEGFESDHPCEMMSGKNDWCEINCNYAFPTKECWLHYANMILESEKE